MKRYKRVLHAPSINEGWQRYYDTLHVPPEMLEEVKLSYLAGAATLFYAMIHMLDEDTEPTEADLAKMDAIHKEVEEFAKTFDYEAMKRLRIRGVA